MDKMLKNMAKISDTKFRTYRDRIQSAKNNKSIAFILGGGISADFNIPLWNDLIVRILANYWKRNGIIADVENDGLYNHCNNFIKDNELNLTILARYLRNVHGKNEWKDVVSELLYNELTDKFYNKAISQVTVLRFLSQFANECKGTIFLTYNFDSLFEEMLQMNSVDSGNFKSFCGPKGRIYNDRTNIFHLHGYLPHPTRAPQKYNKPSDEIIICEDDYHNSSATPVAWHNTIPLSTLLTKTCIFVGTSLKDTNQRRLLDIYKSCVEIKNNEDKSRGFRFHYALLQHPEFEKNNHPTQIRKLNLGEYTKIQEEILHDLRIYPIWYKEHTDLTLILSTLLY